MRYWGCGIGVPSGKGFFDLSPILRMDLSPASPPSIVASVRQQIALPTTPRRIAKGIQNSAPPLPIVPALSARIEMRIQINMLGAQGGARALPM
jgi:hypothetical protein